MTNIALAILLFFFSAKIPPIKIGAINDFIGYSGSPLTTSDQRHNQFLDYYKALGYTHIMYELKSGSNSVGSFQKRNSKWQYNGGNYFGGDVYTPYKLFYDAARKRGLAVIPKVSTLSHAKQVLDVDIDAWEFTKWTWLKFRNENDIPDTDLGRVLKPVDNQPLNEIFGEQLEIIKAVQGRNIPYIHLGFDEPAYAHLLLIKRDKSQSFQGTASALIATSLEDRIKQIDAKLGNTTQVIIYADGYIPGHQGNVVEQIRDELYTNGSVLALIKASAIASSRTILMPWGYNERDNQDIVAGSIALTTSPSTPGPQLYDKIRQLSYIDKIGLPYIVMMGEGAGVKVKGGPYHASIVNDESYEFNERQCTFEWLKATQQYPTHFMGIAHVAWGPTDECNTQGLCVGYQAPIISYLGWHSNGDILDWVANNSYSPEIFNSLNYKNSRKNFSWTQSIDYNSFQLLKGGK